MANEKTNKPAKKKRTFNFHPVRYCKEMMGELKKLTWLSKKELASHTLAVFAFVLGMALLIYVLDLVFSTGFSLIERIG